MTPKIPSDATTRGLVTLTPIELRARDDSTDRALYAANGGSAERDANLRDALIAFVVVLAFVVVGVFLAGCSALSAITEGAKTARDVARAGCAILEASDGSTLDVLRATQDLQRAMLDASAKAAVEKGAEPDRVAQDMRTIAALAETLKIATTAIVQASGNEPARVTPCPAATSTSTSLPEVDGGAP